MNRDYDQGSNAFDGAATLPYVESQPAGGWFRGIRRVIDEGRRAIERLHLSNPASSRLERDLADLVREIAPSGAKVRICVLGRAKLLPPAVEDEVSLIAREALRNALRHAEATCIEVEVEYLSDRLRLVVRDNGIGIDRELFGERGRVHLGLADMRERASGLGAQLRLLSRANTGTEVEVSLALQLAYLYAGARNGAAFETSPVA